MEIQTNFILRLSTLSVNVGDKAPSDAGLPVPVSWIPTGDCFGISNTAGTGNSLLSPSVSVAVNTGTVNITGLNFGIERLPNSDNKSANYPLNIPGQQYAIPGLTGSDPEDGILGTGKTYKITSVPNNAVLFYNGALVSTNQVITAFDPILFMIDPSDREVLCTFTYASMDSAGLFDLSPATVTIDWKALLPVTLLDFTAKLNGSKVDLKWATATESNSDYFQVERSLDNNTFTATGNTVKAAGNSNTELQYQQQDNISSLIQNSILFYKLKLVDMDGKVKYSKVVALRLFQKTDVVVWPNPFRSTITISITTDKETVIDIRLIDVSGRTIRNSSQPASKGIVTITIDELDKLPRGMYLVEIVNKKAGTTYQKLLTNN